jgi:hypothetical protein
MSNRTRPHLLGLLAVCPSRTSAQGVNDTTTLDKTVMPVVTASFSPR